MSNGGLLQKAMEQQSTTDSEVVAAVIAENSDSEAIPISKVLSTLAVGAVLPMVILMWFGIYLDFIPLSLLFPLVCVGSMALVWRHLRIGLPTSAGGNGMNAARAGIVVGTYLTMILIPIILGGILVGEMSLGEVEFSEDGSTMEVKIRQNGGSANPVDATISIGDWSTVETLSINQEDGFGDYGGITLMVEDFYTENALPSNPYTLTVTVEGNIMSTTLDSSKLSRTVTDVQSSTSAAFSTDSDDCGTKDSCVVGVVLSAWAGLDTIGDNPPSPMPLAEYTISAAMYYEGSEVAIAYPVVEVDNTIATWDSENGQYGGGSAIVGDFGSQITLEGSISDIMLNAKYIPIADWEVNDYGCYSFYVFITQLDPWSPSVGHIDYTSYYIYAEEGAGGDNPNNTDESWTKVTSCDD
ncbi:MAG: hypothetical protein VX723_00230 [Candidatus Thermoplasmatota archaeon]|nr:hypothetical protein [Candidatus Thermoplasmatota archaeon]